MTQRVIAMIPHPPLKGKGVDAISDGPSLPAIGPEAGR